MSPRKFLFTALLASLSACGSSQPSDVPAASPAPKAAATAATPSVQAETQGKSDMSPLQNLLSVFAAPNAPAWQAFDTVHGVTWRDAKPLDNPDATGPDMSRYRSGNLLLAGFGMVDVPDGKTGEEAGTKQDNEGNVGVTLNGDAATVQSIVLVKFYPSENSQEILQHQLNGGAGIKPIGGSCELDFGTTAANTQKNAFYQVTLGANTAPVFAEAYVDEDGGNQGPGSTTFVFYRSKPAQRMAAMRCKET